ncbi:MAG: PqqD family protein [Legionellaceae bacterium]|nr:PqqD family protein [Legionellaceae bacterium]
MLAINQDVVFTQIDKDIVMMDPNSGEYHGLNTVGAELWNLLDSKPMSQDGMVSYLQKEYGLDEATATTDVHVFVDAMLKQDFLVKT